MSDPETEKQDEITRNFWVNKNYKDKWLNFSGYTHFVENAAIESVESIDRARDAFKTMFPGIRIRGEYQCSALPYRASYHYYSRDLSYLNIGIIFNESLVWEPFTNEELYSAYTVPLLEHYSLTHLHKLYCTYRTSKILIKCGPITERKLFRYQDIILANILEKVDFTHPFIAVDHTKIDPHAYCRTCEFRMFERLNSNDHCSLCYFTRMARFHTPLFELRAHFEDCDGAVPSEAMLKKVLSSGDEEAAGDKAAQTMEGVSGRGEAPTVSTMEEVLGGEAVPTISTTDGGSYGALAPNITTMEVVSSGEETTTITTMEGVSGGEEAPTVSTVEEVPGGEAVQVTGEVPIGEAVQAMEEAPVDEEAQAHGADPTNHEEMFETMDQSDGGWIDSDWFREYLGDDDSIIRDIADWEDDFEWFSY